MFYMVEQLLRPDQIQPAAPVPVPYQIGVYKRICGSSSSITRAERLAVRARSRAPRPPVVETWSRCECDVGFAAISMLSNVSNVLLLIRSTPLRRDRLLRQLLLQQHRAMSTITVSTNTVSTTKRATCVVGMTPAEPRARLSVAPLRLASPSP